ncbi:MAG: hypothetical protein ACI8RZ_005015 [Myxococcota bacterium]|jgi:hypothetical protein
MAGARMAMGGQTWASWGWGRWALPRVGSRGGHSSPTSFAHRGGDRRGEAFGHEAHTGGRGGKGPYNRRTESLCSLPGQPPDFTSGLVTVHVYGSRLTCWPDRINGPEGVGIPQHRTTSSRSQESRNKPRRSTSRKPSRSVKSVPSSNSRHSARAAFCLNYSPTIRG